MNWKIIAIVLLAILVFLATDHLIRRRVTFMVAHAAALKRGKPLLNAGCGTPDEHTDAGYMINRSDINLDIRELEGVVPNFVQGDIQEMPFEDKQFGVAYCSHALEHMDDVHKALSELYRVADEVYFVLPRWWAPSNYMNHKHKWIFIADVPVRIHKGVSGSSYA